MAFYLIENIEESNFSTDFIPLVVQAAITQVAQQKISAVQNAILKVSEKMSVANVLRMKVNNNTLFVLGIRKISNKKKHFWKNV